MLDAARERAREVGHVGALYPWRTINGEEASAWYAAGTAQYHINADIAYALRHYRGSPATSASCSTRARRCWSRPRGCGWSSASSPSARRRFCINGVTGPDEYTTVVDNNAYTNLMAKENLEGAVRVIEWLRGEDPVAHAELVLSTG